jgi:hypothetical protein
MIKVFKKHKGLGDTVEMLTTATGIKFAVDMASKLTGKDCGCGEKKDFLNKEYSYAKRP